MTNGVISPDSAPASMRHGNEGATRVSLEGHFDFRFSSAEKLAPRQSKAKREGGFQRVIFPISKTLGSEPLSNDSNTRPPSRGSI